MSFLKRLLSIKDNNEQTTKDNSDRNIELKKAMNQNVINITNKNLCSEKIIDEIIAKYPNYWTTIVRDIDEKDIPVTEDNFQSFQQKFNAIDDYPKINLRGFDYRILFETTKSPQELKQFSRQIKRLTIENLNSATIMLDKFSKDYISIEDLKNLEEEGIELTFMQGVFRKFNKDDLEFLKGLKELHFDGHLQYIAFYDKDEGLTLEECQKLREKYPKEKGRTDSVIQNILQNYPETKSIENGGERIPTNNILQQNIERFKEQISQKVSDPKVLTPETIKKHFNKFQENYRETYVKSAKAAPHILACLKIIIQTDTKEDALAGIRSYIINDISRFEKNFNGTLEGLCNLLVCNSIDGNKEEEEECQVIWTEIHDYLRKSGGFFRTL